MRSIIVAAVIVAFIVSLAGCGDGGSGDTQAKKSDSWSAYSTAERTKTEAEISDEIVKKTGEAAPDATVVPRVSCQATGEWTMQCQAFGDVDYGDGTCSVAHVTIHATIDPKTGGTTWAADTPTAGEDPAPCAGDAPDSGAGYGA